jgi:hypothetical protein
MATALKTAGPLLPALLGLLAAAPAAAQVPADEGLRIDGPPPPVAPAVLSRDTAGNATVRAVRLTGSIRIDGVLDEPFYSEMPSIDDFIQSIPDNGAPPSERTEAWIGFDDTDIYVSARNWDSAPESEWVANEMRRDTNQLRNNDTFGVMFDTFYDRRNGVMFYTNPLGALAEFAMTNEGNPNMDWNPIWDVRAGRFEGGWTVEMRIPFKSLRYRPGRDQVWGIQLRRAVRRRNEWDHLTYLPLSVAGGGGTAIFRVSRAGTLVGLQAPPSRRLIEVKPYGIASLSTNLVSTPQVRNDLDGDGGVDAKVGITDNLTADFTYRTDFAQVEVDEQQVNLTRFNLQFPEKREFFLEGRGIFDFASSGGGGFGGGGVSAPTMFFSRRIGLAGRGANTTPVPILGGGRVTGKVGAFDVGVINIQTDDLSSVAAESTNFAVVRVRRDLLRRSALGVLFENRSQSTRASGSNQLYGMDGSFAFFEDLSVLGYYATTRTEGLIGSDDSYRARVEWAGDLVGGRVDHLFIGEDFNPEVGFLRRLGIRETFASARLSPRPAPIDWIRQMTFSVNADYIENHPAGYVESREIQGQYGIEMENSDQFSLSYTESYESLQDTFNIATGVAIPTGRYDFRSGSISYNFGLQRPYSGNLSAEYGSFYDGTRTTVGFQRARIEVTPQLSMEPSLSFNWVDLEGGSFTQHVGSLRMSYSFSPRLYLSGLVQYSTSTDALSGNFRLRWEYAPGSEFFLVYTEERNTDVFDRFSELSNRGLVVKLTRLFRW